MEKHNLNLNFYSFEELLGLFDLKYQISLEDMKKAKKKVLMLHPDKSKLPPEYFLFYKKAFDIVLNYYNNLNKMNEDVSMEEIEYKPIKTEITFNKETSQAIKKNMEKITKEEFQAKFNKVFEENMAKKVQNKNEWFEDKNPLYTVSSNVTKSNMDAAFHTFKERNQALTKYQGVQNLYSSGGTNFYDDDEDTNTYVTSDPFGKLKYDDLRKVHKDETVFSISENDYRKVQKYKNMDEFHQARSKQDLKPLDERQSQNILNEQNRLLQEQMSQKQYKSMLRTEEYEEKNKNIISNFLHLGW
jgi:hypothetical protein